MVDSPCVPSRPPFFIGVILRLMFVAGGKVPSATNINRSITPIKKEDVMEYTENPPYWFWHQGIVNNNIVSSVNMEAVSRTLSRLVLIKDNKSSI